MAKAVAAVAVCPVEREQIELQDRSCEGLGGV